MPGDRPQWDRSRAPRPPGDGPGIGGARPTPPQPNPGELPRPPGRRPGPSGGGPVPPVTPRPMSPSDGGKGFQITKNGKRIAGVLCAVVLLVGAGFLVSQGKSEELAVNSNEINVDQTDVDTTSVDNSVVTVPITKGSEWESLARSVVFIDAQGSQCGWTGSGSIVADGSYVLTNQHVAGNGECDLTVWLTDSTTTSPTKYLTGQFVEADSSRDLAIIRMIDSGGVPYVDETRAPLKFSNSLPKLGDKLTILGYPGLGGSSITLTSGDFSGVDSSEDFDFLKTTANMNPGVSGGAALNSDGELVGIPTAGRGAVVACNQQSDCVANGSTIGLLRPVSLASELLARIGS